MIQFAVIDENSFSGELFNDGRTINLSAGEVLHDVHDSCSALGKVVGGKLRLSRLLSTGREIIIKEFVPGEIFAELLVFTGDNYPGWLIATIDSEIVEVDRGRVMEHLKDPKSLLSYISGISLKMNHLSDKIEIMSLKTVAQKIAYCLLTDGVLSLSVTRTADYLGCSREALSRAISELEKDGMIERRGRTIIPVDKLRLENLF
ncbi:MAG TPA: hypothetical protein DCO79_09830 [Spirochaeta sp.]|nr:hypothetical protein [Spirochaeta sp.]